MPLDIICGCTARFVSDQVGNPEDRFSHNEAQIIFDKVIIYIFSHNEAQIIFDKVIIYI